MSHKAKLRSAAFGDIPQILDMMLEAHKRSKYVDFAPINEARAKSFLMGNIQKQGGNREGSTFCAVVDRGNKQLEGFIIGALQSLYFVSDALEATDIYFYARTDAKASTAPRLMRSMHKWANKCEVPCVIRQANSDIITDHKKSGPLFERAGMRCVGFVYEKETKK